MSFFRIDLKHTNMCQHHFSGAVTIIIMSDLKKIWPHVLLKNVALWHWKVISTIHIAGKKATPVGSRSVFAGSFQTPSTAHSHSDANTFYWRQWTDQRHDGTCYNPVFTWSDHTLPYSLYILLLFPYLLFNCLFSMADCTFLLLFCF